MNDHLTNPIPIQCHWLSLCWQSDHIKPIRLLFGQRRTPRPIQYQSNATWLSLCCQSDQAMPLRLLYCQWMTTPPIQYQSSATRLSRWCQSDQKCQTYYCTANEWPINQSNTNPVTFDCHCAANGTKQCHSITLLPMNDHSTNPMPIQCHLTVTELQIRQYNTTHIILLPMNNHSTNPMPIQCHSTVTELPIRK